MDTQLSENHKTPLLVLNGAEGRLDVILCCNGMNGTIDASYSIAASSQGAERLTPLLYDACKQHHIAPHAIRRIACVVGPGSFTGLRLTLVTAAALRRTSLAKIVDNLANSSNKISGNSPITSPTAPHEALYGNAHANPDTMGTLLYGINYLQAIASSLQAVAEGYIVRVITHARRGTVYTQDFMTTVNVAAPVSELKVQSIDETLCMPCGTSQQYPDILVGSGIARNQEAIYAYYKEHNQPTRILPASCAHPNAAALYALCPAYTDPAWQAHDLEPAYLRPCDAEDNLAHIATKDGRSPEKAHQTLAELLQAPPTA